MEEGCGLNAMRFHFCGFLEKAKLRAENIAVVTRGRRWEKELTIHEFGAGDGSFCILSFGGNYVTSFVKTQNCVLKRMNVNVRAFKII